MQFANTILPDFKHLFYPHICSGCGSDILADDNLLCAKCFVNLPFTFYAQYADNPIEKIFWGRIPIAAAHAEFYFAKESLIQQLIHQLKYKSNREIGMYLGEMLGRTLISSKRFNQIDGLIPLPLFPDKERKRGYNQAAIICNGMSDVMKVPVLNNVLVRQRFTETQTKKHRTERWENVEGSFAVKNEALVKGKHLLLVDDVITTGATLEASGHCLLKTEGIKLSIATLTAAVK
ncbi:MAG: ComF family protein [Chitinophagaceae bacterium]|nr:ComF family protein [Chitinophagaceae bacterium]